MKRIVTVILALVLLFGCFSFSASAEEPNVTRDTVLLLDNSISMEGTPLAYLKKAAKKFCSSVLAAEGENRVSIVIYDTGLVSYTELISDESALYSAIDSMSGDGSWTNISLAVNKGDEILSASSASIKNLVIMTDGLPTYGESAAAGRYYEEDCSDYYDYTGHYIYEFANALYEKVAKLFPKYSVYSLGFFHTISSSRLPLARKLMNDIQNSGYYEVDNPDELEFQFGQVVDDITHTNELKELSFVYGGNHTATCYYTDDYFSESSYQFNPSLGTMSIAFAMSAFGNDAEASYETKSVNAKKLLMDIGVDETTIQTNDWFKVKPTTDSIGTVAGSKPIRVNGQDYTLIALAVRGGGYEREWASNFTIGTAGQHDGFEEAKNNVIHFLKQYISDQNISGPVKLWITGYSRAAATSNLVAGALDDGTVLSSSISYQNSDIYTYCFETPKGALKEDAKDFSKTYYDEESDTVYQRYENIFSIINSSDPVPYVAPAQLGFVRYGIDYFLPSAESDSDYIAKKNAMLQVYRSLPTTGEYIVDQFQMKKLGFDLDINWDWFNTSASTQFVFDDTDYPLSQGGFLSNYVSIISKEFVRSRANFIANYQDGIREICSVVFGCTSEQSKVLRESLIRQAKEQYGQLAKSYIYNTGVKGLWGAEDEYAALQMVSEWLLTAVKEAGIEDYDKNVIDQAGKKLADLALALISNHPNYFTTACFNGSGLAAAHYPELCYSWMASMDPNFKPGAVNSFNNGSYRVIRINCAVDVSVYDESDNLVAYIKDESPQRVENSSIISAINEDGEKIVFLPVDTDYVVKVTAREDDNVNYGIDEYCALAEDYTRAVDFFDIAMEAGESLTGSIPAYSQAEIKNDTPDGSTAQYTLFEPAGDAIEASADVSGEEAQEQFYMIEVASSDESLGVVTGSGIRQGGNFAKVEAIAKDSNQFDGWYLGNECVSEDAVFRFCVNEDVKLVARFEKADEPDYSFVDVEKGKYYYDAVLWAVNHDPQITKGVDATHFAPSSTCTREQVVTYLWRANGCPEPTKQANPFKDVKPSDYFYKAVLWAYENGITTGNTETTFNPNGGCTRAHVVTFLWRAHGSPEPAANSNPFKDVAKGTFCYKAVLWAMENHITTGRTVMTFEPTAACTRANAVTFLYRAHAVA